MVKQRESRQPDGRLQDERADISNRLQERGAPVGGRQGGLEKRSRRSTAHRALDKQIAGPMRRSTATAAVPARVVERPPESAPWPTRRGVRARRHLLVRRHHADLDRLRAPHLASRSRRSRRGHPHDIIDRFTQIDQAVESIAVEVERIGEGQRFITRVLAEQGKRPALEAAPPSRGPARRADGASALLHRDARPARSLRHARPDRRG
jgi:hypothetical protein